MELQTSVYLPAYYRPVFGQPGSARTFLPAIHNPIMSQDLVLPWMNWLTDIATRLEMARISERSFTSCPTSFNVPMLQSSRGLLIS